MALSRYDPIRPYSDSEFREALPRILSNPDFKRLAEYLIPGVNTDEYFQTLSDTHTVKEFQLGFVYKVFKSILSKFSVGLTASGFENISKDESYVFIANHRDIVLDSSILCLLLVENGFEATEITWGDNLMISPLVVDIGKANRMITVFREGSPKEMLKNSILLSSYIRELVTSHDRSVWIAQRKGRTKDGNDTTDVSVLKMLSLTGERSAISSLKELKIVPVSISYEWEPCDGMKVRELYVSHDQEYVKEEDEDLNSIIGGVISNKGRIHLHIGKPINDSLDKISQDLRPNETLEQVALEIDQQIQAGYKLWPSNKLAYDLLENGDFDKSKYDEQTAEKFQRRMNQALEMTVGEKEIVKDYFLKLYANPVYNKKDI
jgi:1-acyl-sn-glycerol-3-phosphate acyltransferase